MADKKKAKQRPDKYAEKVKLNISMDEALKALAKDANKKVEENLPHVPVTVDKKREA
ncbi:MAG: hypothetical protein JSS82_06955 [Bacteroidetes bacterium]|nr:hypothetical protein [Bacteroidota bacterium]